MTVKVSVGMPVYNGERWLPDAIESILGQTCTDLELIISDNASTDATEQICRDYAARDNRVHYYRNERNLGVSPNFNAVFLHARAPYFKWAAASDHCAPTFLQRCIEELEQHPEMVMCFPRAQLFVDIPGDGKDYQESLSVVDDAPGDRFINSIERMGLNNAMCGVIRSDVLRKTLLYESYLSADVIMMAELSLYGKFLQIPDVLFYRRMRPETATTLQSKEQIMRYYDPEKTSPRFHAWRYHWARIRVILRTPLPWREKFNLLNYAIRHFRWARAALADDLREVWVYWKHRIVQ